MVPGETYTKDPNDRIAITFNWTAWLLGATITSSVWVVETVNSATGTILSITPATDTILTGNLKTQAVIQDGAVDAVYRVTNRIGVSGSPTQQIERSIFVNIVNL
jgi:hypothetical protein